MCVYLYVRKAGKLEARWTYFVFQYLYFAFGCHNIGWERVWVWFDRKSSPKIQLFSRWETFGLSDMYIIKCMYKYVPYWAESFRTDCIKTIAIWERRNWRKYWNNQQGRFYNNDGKHKHKSVLKLLLKQRCNDLPASTELEFIDLGSCRLGSRNKPTQFYK